jgi:hypothetical protein
LAPRPKPPCPQETHIAIATILAGHQAIRAFHCTGKPLHFVLA